MTQDQDSGTGGSSSSSSSSSTSGPHSSSGTQEWSWLNFGVAMTKYEGPATAINLGMTLTPYLGVMKDSKQKAVVGLKVYAGAINVTMAPKFYDKFVAYSTEAGLYTVLKEDIHTVIEAKGIGAAVSAQATIDTIAQAVQKGVKAGTVSMYCGTKGMKASV